MRKYEIECGECGHVHQCHDDHDVVLDVPDFVAYLIIGGVLVIVVFMIGGL